MYQIKIYRTICSDILRKWIVGSLEILQTEKISDSCNKHHGLGYVNVIVNEEMRTQRFPIIQYCENYPWLFKII